MTYGEKTDAESDSEKYLEQLHRRIHDEKSYLKKSWKELKEALDILYQVVVRYHHFGQCSEWWSTTHAIEQRK